MASRQEGDGGSRTATSPRPRSLGREQGPPDHSKRQGGQKHPKPPRCCRVGAPQQPRSHAGMESGHRAAPCPRPISGDRQKGLCDKLPGQQVASRTGQRGRRQSSSRAHGEVPPGTLPVSEPWSQPGARSLSEGDTTSPGASGTSQHRSQPRDFRSSTQADFQPWLHQHRAGRAHPSPSTPAKQWRKTPGATRKGSAHPSRPERDVSARAGHSARSRRLSSRRAQREGRSPPLCPTHPPPARARSQDAISHPRRETPREHVLPSLLG